MVIAYFSTSRALAYILSILLLCAVLYAVTLYHPAGIPLTEYLQGRHVFGFYYAIAFWILGAFLVLRQLIILNQLIFRRSEAIWISQDSIFYIDIGRDVFFRSVKCADVESFSPTNKGGPILKGILLRLRSGAEIKITTTLLRESEETILARLEERCARI